MSHKDLLSKVDSLSGIVSSILGVETVSSELEDDEPVLVIFVDKGLVVEGELPIEHEGVKVVVRESGGDATAHEATGVVEAKERLEKMLEGVTFVHEMGAGGSLDIFVKVYPNTTDLQIELIPTYIGGGWQVEVVREEETVGELHEQSEQEQE